MDTQYMQECVCVRAHLLYIIPELLLCVTCVIYRLHSQTLTLHSTNIVNYRLH